MGSFRQWWRRATAAVKDRRSLLLARVRPRRAWRDRELEAAVIRATSHEERWVDYRSAGRVFRWARTSPSLVRPIVWALGRRARRTRSWAVALKALMVAHGMLLRSGVSPCAARVGRVPFELADFRDRSAPPAKSPAFSAFVRAYFRFLEYRSLLAAEEVIDGDDSDHCTDSLDRITKLQFLLELLLQIRPYGDGMEGPLVLEAMDCALIEIFQVYSEICTGVARFLVSVPRPTRPWPSKSTAAAGIKVLWRAAEQSAQLSSYFELCHSLGVVNARRLPAFERLRDEDVRDLERLLTRDADEEVVEIEGDGSSPPVDPNDTGLVASSAVATTTTEWVAFDEDKAGAVGWEASRGSQWNPFVAAASDVGIGGPEKQMVSGPTGVVLL